VEPVSVRADAIVVGRIVSTADLHVLIPGSGDVTDTIETAYTFELGDQRGGRIEFVGGCPPDGPADQDYLVFLHRRSFRDVPTGRPRTLLVGSARLPIDHETASRLGGHQGTASGFAR
jgi:hypothetical protein